MLTVGAALGPRANPEGAAGGARRGAEEGLACLGGTVMPRDGGGRSLRVSRRVTNLGGYVTCYSISRRPVAGLRGHSPESPWCAFSTFTLSGWHDTRSFATWAAGRETRPFILPMNDLPSIVPENCAAVGRSGRMRPVTEKPIFRQRRMRGCGSSIIDSPTRPDAFPSGPGSSSVLSAANLHGGSICDAPSAIASTAEIPNSSADMPLRCTGGCDLSC